MKTTIVLLLVLAVLSTIFIAGCTQQQPLPTPQPTAVPTTQPADTVKTSDTGLGKILVDAQGNTLYYFANDIASAGTSACTGQCPATWPAFSAATIQVSAPLDPADFASITRADGSRQTTYYGWPLYHYSGDTKPGDTNGNGILNLWFVINPDESVLISHNAVLGSYLTDTSGKTLYFFGQDTTGQSACTGSCITTWPPFSAAPLTAPSLLSPSDFSQVSRADGLKQTAFMGRPLYYYSGDSKPGNVNGEGFANRWHVASTSGNLPVVTTLPTTLPTTVRTTVIRTTIASNPYYGGGY